MEAAMAEIGVVARAVVVPCGRRRQDAARAVALEETVLHLLDDGCERVIVEARTPAQDGRERPHLHELIQRLGASGCFSCDWDTKSEPLLWLADALGGAVHDHLTGTDGHGWYDRFAKETGLTISYRCLPCNS
jgi:hypothetical protein